MKETYTKLMVHQEPSPEADAAFFEKLELAQPNKKMKPLLRAAIVAASLCLLIPVTVYAVTNFFNRMQVTKTERPTLDNKPGIGLDIVYEDIEYLPLSSFSQLVQDLEEPAEALYDSWIDAEEYLGIDLINNALFTAEDTRFMAAYGERGKHCQSLYYVWDGQFAGFKMGTTFRRRGIEFGVSALAMTEHAAEYDYDEDIRNNYYGSSMTYVQYPVREVTISTEEYITKGGIPVLLVTVTRDARDSTSPNEVKQLFAFFAVNNISYRVMMGGYSVVLSEIENFTNKEEMIMATMYEVLDGFVIE